MQIDFKELRDRIRIVDVLAVKGIKLTRRFGPAANSDYASGPCPLKTHPQKRNNSFAVHLPTNRFQCKDTTCQKANGVGDKWGDCLNLVAAMEGISFRDAAQKLVEWFPEIENPAIPKDSGATRPAGDTSRAQLPAHLPVKANGSDNGKGNGFMHETNAWLDQVMEMEDRAALKKLLAGRIYESYQNGKAARN